MGDEASPVTVIHRFTGRPDQPAELSRALGEHAAFLRDRPGFDFSVQVRLADRPDVHVQLGYWHSHRAYRDAVRDPRFVAHVRQVRSLVVHADADQGVSVARVVNDRYCVDGPARDATGVLAEYLVDGDHAEFQHRTRAWAESLPERPGFGGLDLMRSILRPHRYLGVVWWFDGAGRPTVPPGTPEGTATVHAALVRVEQTGPVSYLEGTPSD